MKKKNQFTNRILSLVLAFMMVAGLLPMNMLTASAADTSSDSVTIDFSTVTQDILLGENHTYSLDGGATYAEYVGNLTFTGTTTYSIIVNDGAGTHDIILDNVSMSNKNENGNIKIDAGEVLNLTLKGTNTLMQTGGNLSNCAPAINLRVGATLTITEASTGVLTAQGGYASPAIGGRWYFTVNINGGTVNVSPNKITGGGIGFVYNAVNTFPTNIRINNAVVNATGDNHAAIGGGDSVYSGGSDVNITITNSTVTAKALNDGVAAIGGGKDDKNTYHIKIENSVVSATAGMYYGAAIGISRTGTVGNIEIINSVVTAKAGNQAAGIGGGPDTNVGNILIQNSTVTATGGDYAAGIGGGFENTVLGNDKVTIIGSNVHASGDSGIRTIGIGYAGAAFPIQNHNGNDITLNKITLQGVSRDVKVTKIVTATGYEAVDIMTIGGVLYIYLPEDESPTKVIANGQEYVGTVTDKVGTFVFEHTCEVGEKGTPASCGKYAVCGLCKQDFGEMPSHDYGYSANGNVLTESCPNCEHNETATLEADESYVYTGTAINKAVVEYSDGWQGEKPTEIRYDGNISVGTATAKIEIEGKEISTTFEIKAADINGATVTFNPENGIYNGSEQKPAVSVVWNGAPLAENTDYTLTWDNPDLTNADSYTVTVTGKGNFAGTKDAVFSIDPADIKDAVVTLDQNTFVYDGNEHKPKVTVIFNGATLQEGADYKVTYLLATTVSGGKPTKWFGTGETSVECINANENYYAVVEGIGNYYTKDQFTLCASFVIEKSTVTEPTIASKPCNNSVQKADISDTDLYTVVKNEGGTARGSYDVVLKLKDSANYKWSTTDNEEVTVQFVISAAQNIWETTPAISGWTYGETANAPTYKAKFGTVKVVYSGKANDGTDYNSETAPTKSGSYTATFTVEGTEEYSGLSEQVNFTVAKATYDMTGAKWDYTAAFDYDGNEKTVTVSGLPKGVTVSGYSGNKATVTGNYIAKVTLSYDNNNYNAPAVADLNWKIENNWSPTEYTVSTLNDNGWINKEFVIAAANGYLVSTTNTAAGEWKENLTYSAETADGNVTFYLRNLADDTISLGKTVTYNLDKTVPTGKLEFVERSSWQDFVNTITFGLFYKDEVTVKVTAGDELSGIYKIEYTSDDKAMTLDQVMAIADWTEYTESFGVTLEDAKKFVYFVRVTDNAGNVTYLSTDGAEYDTTAPVINSIENGKTYYTTQKVTVTEKNVDTITLNNNPATENITLEGNKEATYTIVAVDKAGNSTTVTVTMKPISELSAPIGGLTTDNVNSSYEQAVDGVKAAVSAVDTTNATEVEKAALKDILDKATVLEKIIDDTVAENNRISAAVASYDPATVTFKDKEDLEKLLADIIRQLESINLTEKEISKLKSEKKAVEDMLAKLMKDAGSPNEDIIKSPDTDNLWTDGNDNHWLWIILLSIGGAGIFGITITNRKRKATSKK